MYDLAGFVEGQPFDKDSISYERNDSLEEFN